MASASGPEEVGVQHSELEQIREGIRVNRADIDDLMAQGQRMDELEARLDVDDALIAELQGEGLVAQQQVAQLQLALRTSRTIGAALGIIMAEHQVDEHAAFALLSKHSQDTNRKLKVIADEIVRHRDSRVVLDG